MTTYQDHDSSERRVLVYELGKQRALLRRTVDDITDDQARIRTTASALCLAGILKHVAAVERQWTKFIVEGPAPTSGFNPAIETHAATFKLQSDETLAGLLVDYEQVAGHTHRLAWQLESLEVSQPLPEAPWFPPGARWSARQVFLHILAETAQHSGHADIIRESLDGAKTMG